jgi:hypothetical protein
MCFDVSVEKLNCGAYLNRGAFLFFRLEFSPARDELADDFISFSSLSV